MEIYSLMRQFADSWGLLYMMVIFLAVVALTFRPGSRKYYQEKALIPLKEEQREDV